MADPSARPIVDPEALGRMLYEAWDDPPELDPDTGHDLFTAAAVLIRDAVVPEGYRVVPTAEHDRLMAALDTAALYGRLGDVIPALLSAYRAALGKERP